jgi:hypothetical protein
MNVLFLLPDPDQPGLTDAERLGLRVRNDASITGQCACGAIMTLDGMEHEHDCPAVSPLIERLARRLGDAGRYIAVERHIA